MRALTLVCWIAGAVVTSTAASCDGGEDDASQTSDGGGGTLRVHSFEPPFLFPAMTTNAGGGDVLDALFSPLVDVDDAGNPIPVVAAEVPTSENRDNIHWTISIKDGWTFHNGEPVTAASFVDAWNWAAYGPNFANTSYFFGPGLADVAGYADVQNGPDPDGDGPQAAPDPVATELAGLQVVDDSTFTVELARPFSQFPLLLSHHAFFPVPAGCLDDWETCTEAPIGNGPFKMDGKWNHNEVISVVRNDDYAGPTMPNIDRVQFRISSDLATAYLDLKDGHLDYLTEVPERDLADARERFGDRLVEHEPSGLGYLGFPLWDSTFGGPAEDDLGGEEKANLRHALSMAINRQELIDEVYADASAPADSLVAPVVPGYREAACGAWCEYDLAAARALYEKSSKIDHPVNLWFGETADHEESMTAVGNYWNAAFGIEYQLQARVWADFLQAQNDHALDGPFRLGWGMDFPSAHNFLAPIYGEGVGEPNFGYTNDAVDALLSQANSAATIDEGRELYNQAEDLILEDMPTIPLVFGSTTAAYNANVSGLSLDKFGYLELVEITVSE